MANDEWEIAHLQATVREKNRQVAKLQRDVTSLHQQLETIASSRGWRWLQRVWRLKRAIVPSAHTLPAAVPSNILALLQQLSDDEWMQILIGSVLDPTYEWIELPKIPPLEVQRNFVGSSAEQALREVYPFYQLIKKYCDEWEYPLKPQSRVLDFGVGWGRVIRFFMRDVETANLYGVDVLEEAIKMCLDCELQGQFQVITNQPPLSFPDDSFDVIYAYSVFSHLPEELARHWIKEFTRLLKPQGLLFATTQRRSFIELCHSFRGQENTFLWHQLLANSFVDTANTLAAYDRGEFLYAPNGGGYPKLTSTVYGDAVIPRDYVAREWTQHLALRDFLDESALLPQALIVMQKR